MEELVRGLSDRSVLESFYFYIRVNGRTKETQYTYRVHLTELVKFCQSIGKPIVALTREDGMSWVSNAMERLKPGSVNSYLRSFKAFYNYLADEEYIKESPLRRLKLLLVERVLRPTLRPEEVQRLLDSIPKHTYIGARNRAMIMVAYDSMLRVSEIMRLKVQNVKFDDACIEVERSKSKTYRFVPMSRLTIRIIHEFVYRYRDGVPGDLLFPVEDGHKLGRGSFNLILRRVGRAIGISVHPHMLRRSGATGYVRNGGSIEMVKLILGHSSIKITEAYVQIADKETIHLHEDFSPAARMKRSAS